MDSISRFGSYGTCSIIPMVGTMEQAPLFFDPPPLPIFPGALSSNFATFRVPPQSNNQKFHNPASPPLWNF